MLEPQQPRFSEAYPRILISQVNARLGTERPILQWRNHHGHAIGTVRFDWNTEQRLILKPRIQDLPYCEGSTTEVKLSMTSELTGYGNRQYFNMCERCGQRINIVVYCDGFWRCSRCFGFRNRSALMDRPVRITMELEVLENEIGDGRPFRMRQKTYDTKRERMRELVAALGKQPRRSPDKRFRFNITGCWEAETDSLLHFESGFSRGLY